MSYTPGEYYMICDRCGFRRLASEMKKEWNGWWVCFDTCFEKKHPQYTPPKPLGESQKVPIHRPEPPDNFITEKITGDDL